jgi:DNA (cytosine-5)-methyltransferase 1
MEKKQAASGVAINASTSKLGVLSLFTGAGGLDLGLEAAGFKTLLCVENDPDALATLAANRPAWRLAEPNDATKFAKDPIAAMRAAGIRRSDIVLLAGGPPCQPFSKASYWTKHGPRRMHDPRASSSIRSYLRIVAKVRPEVLLFENVAAFAFRQRDEGFSSLVRGLRATADQDQCGGLRGSSIARARIHRGASSRAHFADARADPRTR